MPNTAQVIFTEVDNSIQASEIPVGISGVMLEMSRGPIGVCDTLIATVSDLKKLYGPLSTTTGDALQAYRALNAGTMLRINNIRHYTDITDNTTCDAVLATINSTNGGVSAVIAGAGISAGNYTMSATGYTNAVVAFNTSALLTLRDLVAAFITANPGKIYRGAAYSNSGTATIYMAPTYGNTLASLNITGTGITSLTKTQLAQFGKVISSSMTALFTVTPLAKGAAYNKLVVEVLAPTNGATGYFDIHCVLQGEDSYTDEYYPNIKIDGCYTVSNLTFLDALNKNSTIATFGYVDLSAIATGTVLVPLYGTRTYSSGTDGSATDANDYIGDSAARTGWNAFDTFDDLSMISAPLKSTASILIAGDTYAGTRKDLMHVGHLSNSSTSRAALVSDAATLALDSSYTMLTAGGLSVVHPLNAQATAISEVGDTLGIAASSANSYGPWYSFAGSNRGTYHNVLGVVNNFGSPGSKADLNLLANARINMAITRSRKTQLCGNFTCQVESSLTSFVNVRRLIIYIRKTLEPLLGNYLEDPNTITTWKNIYMVVAPFFSKLKAGQAIYSWDWQGDQFAKNMQSLVVNNINDVSLGKYKVILHISPVPSLQQLTVEITIENGAVTISEA